MIDHKAYKPVYFKYNFIAGTKMIVLYWTYCTITVVSSMKLHGNNHWRLYNFCSQWFCVPSTPC